MNSSDLSSDQEFYSQIPRQSAEILISVRNMISQGFCLSDIDGAILDVNEKLASRLGLKKHEMIKRSISEFLPEKWRLYARLYHREFMDDKQTEVESEEWEYLDRQGAVVTFKVKASKIKLGDVNYKMDILEPVENIGMSASMEEIEKLKQESRHLFKNTLQEVNGLIQLRVARVQEEETRQVMMGLLKRNTVIAAAFEQLYHTDEHFKIELTTYLKRVLEIHKLPNDSLSAHPQLYMDINKSYALGLLLTEIFLSNSEEKEGYILSGKIEGNYYRIRLSSQLTSGKKLLNDFGQQMVKALMRQLMAKEQESESNDVLLNINIPL